MPRNPVIAHLRSRWKDEWNPSGYTGPVAGFPGKVDDAIASFTDEREKLTKSGHLTPAGVQEQLKRNASQSVLPLLKKARGELVAARSAVAEKRRQLTMPQIDKTDVAGALLRREIREHLRSLPVPERIAMVLQSEDPRVMAAYQELPFMAAIPAELVERIEAERLQKLHGPEVRQIEDATEAFEIVSGIVESGFAAVREDLGFKDDKEFAAFVESAA